MPTYSIRLTNSEFESQDDPTGYASLNDALQAAVASAVDIARDMVGDTGETSATVEASVVEGDRVVARRIVTISALMPDDQ